MKLSIFALLVLSILQAFIVNTARAHHHDHDHDTTTTTVDTSVGASASSGGSNNTEFHSTGAAIAGAAGVCVRDWSQGIQYCASWAMLDGDQYDEGVHAFGGGITTRVDKFALSFYGGIENVEDDDKTYMLTGSINWR